MKLTIFITCCVLSLQLNAQIGIGTTDPHPSAILDVESPSKGVLIPRMLSTERDNITNPTAGLTIYCSDCCADGRISFYNGTEWIVLKKCPVVP